MATTYLLTWNPDNFEWDDLDEMIQQVGETHSLESSWTCGGTKQIAPGSRFYLTRLGSEPRGLIGSGMITTAPHKVPHYDEEKRARGETSLSVDIRFDTLERWPILRRLELGEAEFQPQQWDPQASGISIDATIATRLERVWAERLASAAPTRVHLPAACLARWRQRWALLSSNAELMQQDRIRDDQRRVVAPQIVSLINDLRNGTIDLGQFRETFDRRTRIEWDVFGLKGLSGAMFLNKLVKHVPDQAAATAALRDVLRLPANDAEARRRLAEFQRFLNAVIESGEASGADLQPNRAPFLVSACWQMQSLDAWPTFYESARKAYGADGIFQSGSVSPDGYVEFASLTRALADGLHIDLWSLEHICSHMIDGTLEKEKVVVELPIGEAETPRVWLYSPGRNASEWEAFHGAGIAAIGWRGLGDLHQYRDVAHIRETLQGLVDKDAMPSNDALCCWEFANEMQPGDIIFAKRGRKQIIGYGIVKSAYRFDPARGEYPHVHDVDWRKRGEWTPREQPLAMKTLTNIGGYIGLVAQIRSALELDDSDEAGGELENHAKPIRAPYTTDDALQDLFVDEAWLTRTMQLLRYKGNIVLQGPPGVGKTFVARRLAYLLLGERDPERVYHVQFHASYSYEDFIQGYRPNGTGFERVDGPFLTFCDAALQDPGRAYVFMIDEINRGNLSKIFGELLMLLEYDKRSSDWAVRLTYARDADPDFFIPPNVRVIGTMNTADRSLALVDYALRRRFAFVDIPPALQSESFHRHLAGLGASADLLSVITERIAKLNDEIMADRNLGAGFAIGHSYFCHVGLVGASSRSAQVPLERDRGGPRSAPLAPRDEDRRPAVRFNSTATH